MNNPFARRAGGSAAGSSNANGAANGRVNGLFERLSPRQRQYATLVAILVCGVGLLWLIFALTDTRSRAADAKAAGNGTPSAVTNIGVMPPGQQVNPVDQWVGTAGRKLAQYESERDEQTRLNKDRQAFEAQTMKRFAELEQRLTSASQTANAQPVPAPPPVQAPAAPAMPPAASLPPPPPPRTSPVGGMPPGDPGMGLRDAAPQLPNSAPTLTRITLVDRSKPSSAAASGTTTSPDASREARTVSTFLPVSFTRGTLLGGLDAPTGGQSQSNPHPVLIRLSDNSVLPNRFRGEYRDCFVIAAGYGDISSERAYLRTENLSCVRADGATLEVKIQGSVYGEDGKVGMRGRLVTKQGQMLANALLAGVVSGIGQGLATSSTTYSTSALGTIASASGGEAYKAGLGTGVGKALDRLAQYYIKLAENTFPVIEVDAGREIDVVITKGVRIDVPMSADAQRSTTTAPSPDDRYTKVSDDETY
ncbi:MAG: conjugal transfer protein TraB [Ideonella sp.]|nr:conjugal transfer protein TraB [Ideonella sp.]